MNKLKFTQERHLELAVTMWKDDEVTFRVAELEAERDRMREDIKAEGCAPTNGDRVRSMSNEELAEFFKRECPPMEKVNYSCPYSCKDCWIRWLNATAEAKGEARPIGSDAARRE